MQYQRDGPTFILLVAGVAMRKRKRRISDGWMIPKIGLISYELLLCALWRERGLHRSHRSL